MATKEEKKKAAKEGMDKAAKYEKCLMKKKNYDAIIDALADANYTKVQEIFTSCEVPADEQNALLQFAINCYEMRFCQW